MNLVSKITIEIGVYVENKWFGGKNYIQKF